MTLSGDFRKPPSSATGCQTTTRRASPNTTKRPPSLIARIRRTRKTNAQPDHHTEQTVAVALPMTAHPPEVRCQMLTLTPRLDSDGYPVLPEVRQRRNDCYQTAGECPIHGHAPPDAGKRLVKAAALPYQDGDRRAAHNVLMHASQLPSAPRDHLRRRHPHGRRRALPHRPQPRLLLLPTVPLPATPGQRHLPTTQPRRILNPHPPVALRSPSNVPAPFLSPTPTLTRTQRCRHCHHKNRLTQPRTRRPTATTTAYRPKPNPATASAGVLQPGAPL